MSTPEVDLHELNQLVGDYAERLTAKAEVTAVVVTSSAAKACTRREFDSVSDIDFGLYLSLDYDPAQWRADPAEYLIGIQQQLPDWLPDFSFYVPVSRGTVEFNVHQSVIEYELDPRTRWTESRLEAYGAGVDVYCDKRQLLQRLIDQRVPLTTAEADHRILNLTARLEWDVELVPASQSQRRAFGAAHAVLNQAMDELVELVYLLHGRRVPAAKWRLQELDRLGLMTPEERSTLTQLQLILAIDAEDVARRQRAAARLWLAVRQRYGDRIPGDAYRVASATTAPDRQLSRRTRAARLGSDDDLGNGTSTRDRLNWTLAEPD